MSKTGAILWKTDPFANGFARPYFLIMMRVSFLIHMEKSVTEKKQIKRMPTKAKKTIEALPKDRVYDVEWLFDAIDAAWVSEFMEYIRSPWKMLWPNFVAGVARGFGALVWATIVIALIWWFLASLIDLPLIGKKLEPYVERVQTEFQKYTEATNYTEEFRALDGTLKQIENNTRILSGTTN
jgi:hypothetical protein